MWNFWWRVAMKGYVWVSELEDEFGETPEHLEPVMLEWRHYAPFEEPGLFRTFAGLQANKEDFLRFANQYGNLGRVTPDWPDEPPEPPEECTRREFRAWQRDELFRLRLHDTLETWEQSHREMGQAVAVWDRLREGSAGEEDWEWLEMEIDEKLNWGRVELLLVRDSQLPSGFRLEHAPQSLWGAMWIQLATAAAENKDFRECPGCYGWFEISPLRNRRSRKYCSEACRSQAYRDRIAQAVRMDEAGRSLQEIAEVLGAKASTVEGWLKKTKGGQ